ncbi:MAG: RNA polymerase-associated protein rapA [Chromatiales bacterium]|nr:RNA polymerase-associated protein rapA [Chromatiales bacterium]
MNKFSLIAGAIASALAVSQASAFDIPDVGGIEISGVLKNETAVFTRDGQFNGEARFYGDDDSHHSHFGKFENSLKLFLNGALGENATWHGEINAIYDSEGVNNKWKGHEVHSQQDWIRELYADINIANWYVRAGLAQRVWGTADGIKLLDIVNGTDYREFVQNAFEDSRIPTAMIAAESNIGPGNIEFIASRRQENLIPGLNSSGDPGHPFLFKGVDSITGSVNGFLNIVPRLGATAQAFNLFAAGFTFNPDPMNPFFGSTPNLEGVSGSNFTVQNFIDGQTPFCVGGVPGLPGLGTSCPTMLNAIAQTEATLNISPDPMMPFFVPLGGNNGVTNLVTDVYDAWDPNNPFEYMSQASFTTFDTFNGATSEYRRNYPTHENPDVGFRWRQSTDSGLNFSVNYFYHYDHNPSVGIHWEDPVTGQELTPFLTQAPGFDFSNIIMHPMFGPVPAPTGETVTTVRLCKNGDTTGCEANPDPIGNPEVYNSSAATGFIPGVMPDAPAKLVFEETVHRVHSLGGSFDFAFDAGTIPVVVRGEVLYDKDVRVPVVDRSQLGIGNITEGLKPEKADFFKYVLGVDITVLTNLLVSTQFIQFINLDFEDSDKDSITGADCSTTPNPVNCGRYTADPAFLHLENGLAKGQEFKNFFSLFLSKPIGGEQQGRVNNILILEDIGGRWNRLDVEWGLTDNIILTGEWNHYWGESNSLFGQFHNSSNVQAGVKVLLD